MATKRQDEILDDIFILSPILEKLLSRRSPSPMLVQKLASHPSEGQYVHLHTRVHKDLWNHITHQLAEMSELSSEMYQIRYEPSEATVKKTTTLNYLDLEKLLCPCFNKHLIRFPTTTQQFKHIIKYNSNS